VRSLSWETLLHKLLQREPFPWAAALHELPQCGSFPWGAVLAGTGYSSVGPPWGHKSCQQTCSGTGSSLHGSTGPGRSLLQRGFPTGSQPPSGIHLLRHGVLHGLRVDICSIGDLHGMKGDSLPHQGLHHGLQGKTLCSSVSSTSSSSYFFTDLVSAELLLSHHLTPLS